MLYSGSCIWGYSLCELLGSAALGLLMVGWDVETQPCLPCDASAGTLHVGIKFIFVFL